MIYFFIAHMLRGFSIPSNETKLFFTLQNFFDLDAYLQIHKLQSKFGLNPKIKLEKLSFLVSFNSSTYVKT